MRRVVTPTGPTLVISDGDLPSLLACAAVHESGRAQTGPTSSAIWVSVPGDSAQAAAARRQAELYGFCVLELTASSSDALGGVEALSSTLLRAAALASAEGLRCVIWPRNAGERLELPAARHAIERAELVSRLASLEAEVLGRPAIEVRALYADLTDTQIADLALDMDLPIQTCWWWDGSAPDAPTCRQRWGTALSAAGLCLPEGWGSSSPAVTVRAPAGHVPR